MKKGIKNLSETDKAILREAAEIKRRLMESEELESFMAIETPDKLATLLSRYPLLDRSGADAQEQGGLVPALAAIARAVKVDPVEALMSAIGKMYVDKTGGTVEVETSSGRKSTGLRIDIK
jgi:hypothetical protein